MEELIVPEQISPDTVVCSDSGGGCSCHGLAVCYCHQLTICTLQIG